MVLEVFADDPTTTGGAWSTLASGYTSGATSLTITSNAKYAAADPTASPPTQFRVRIDNELFLVTDNRTTTWTVAGAQESSTAANHASGATVTEVVTRESLKALQAPSGNPWFGIGVGAYLRVPVFWTSQAGGTAATNGQLHAIPFFLAQPTTVKSLGVMLNGNGSAGSVTRLGLYADNGASYPGALLVDAGTVVTSTGSPARISTTLSTAQKLSPGAYWVAVVSQGAPATGPSLLRTLTVTMSGIFNAANPTDTITGYQLTGVTGALPDPFTASATGLKLDASVLVALLGA